MAQQDEQAGCFSFLGRKRDKRVEPEGAHHLRGEQNGPQPSGESQPQPQPRRPPQPQPRISADVVTAGVESSNTETPNTGTRSRLGEGEGRRNPVSDDEFRERSNNLKPDENTDENESKLKTKNVDFHNKENRKAHHTDDYEIQQLIVRRGQVFDVTLTFNRDYKSEDDVIVVQLATGKRPQESKGSLVRVAIHDNLTPTTWGMQVKEASGNTVRLSVMSPANATTGQYEVFIETKCKDSSGEILTSRYQHKEPVYILFNAWCADDTVYMESEEERKEYVLEDAGFIWRGTSDWKDSLLWKFGQFDDVSLYSALWLLDKADVSSVARSSPIQISRTISAMANSNCSDGGVLSGRWSNSFTGGVNPSTWTGSTEILEKFWKTKETVKYGQCWVYSGLVTTLMRALGIPTRSVTNYDSAHDQDESMTIDFHFDEEGDIITSMNDSVWNYHVWNESWFKRPDLPEGHDGWQAHDATPQELSAGIFRCGPASVKAVKNGEVYLPYDTGFVFAEVNGDRVFWEVKADGSMEKTNLDRNCIGSFVSTKAVGTNKREDVTNDYKHPEGSEEERRAVKFAFKFSSRDEHELYDMPHASDVMFRVEVVNNVHVGNSFDAAVVVENKSEVTREVKVNFTAVLSFYTGVPSKKLKSYKLKFLLNSQAEKRLVLTIEPTDYMDMLTACDSIKLYVKGLVTDTRQSFATQKDIELVKPMIKVTASESQLVVGQEARVTASFTNPLPIPLTSGQFHLEATRMKPKTLVIDCAGPVGVKEEATMDATFTATTEGTYLIGVSFQSNELTDIHGYCTISEVTWLNNSGF